MFRSSSIICFQIENVRGTKKVTRPSSFLIEKEGFLKRFIALTLAGGISEGLKAFWIL